LALSALPSLVLRLAEFERSIFRQRDRTGLNLIKAKTNATITL